MMYKLTWQTKMFDEWSDPQFVIGSIGSVHKCYNALILAYTPPNGNRRAATLRAVITAVTGDVANPKHIVYEWGWAVDADVQSGAHI